MLFKESIRQLEQSFLKSSFGRSTMGACACCGVYPVSYLDLCTHKKRDLLYIRRKVDLNIVMPMCKFGCDDLFEKGYIQCAKHLVNS
jgi:hypothetical protein